MKATSAAKFEHVTCENCPAWQAIKNDEGEAVLYPIMMKREGAEIVPKTDARGNPVFLKTDDGRFVTKGYCTATLPSVVLIPATGEQRIVFWPEVPSHVYCESERKHELMKLHKIGPYAEPVEVIRGVATSGARR